MEEFDEIHLRQTWWVFHCRSRLQSSPALLANAITLGLANYRKSPTSAQNATNQDTDRQKQEVLRLLIIHSKDQQKGETTVVKL